MATSTSSAPRFRFLNTLLWGNTVALSWVWGLGLFFSVQFTVEFGLTGLLTFLIPNCLGLFLFGAVTDIIARRHPGSESLAAFFNNWSRPFRLVFFLYQVIALSLTIFALIRYGWQPLGLKPDSLYLPLTALVILAAGILFGEEFSIRRIKYSHAAFLALIVCCAVIIILEIGSPYLRGIHRPSLLPTHDWNFWGYVIPICIGFLVGPWLDLQQWQRAIQMRRENTSITAAYAFGAILFGAILLFHGILALWAMEGGASIYIQKGLAGYPYAESLLTRVFSAAPANPWLLGAYLTFLGGCILTTLDSGYIALHWFFKTNASRSKNPIFSLIPEKLITSPIPAFVLCALIAVVGAAAGIELEYFMIFFATFFVGYSALAISRAFVNGPVNVIPQVKMFCIGSLAVVIFAYGYFLHEPIFQILASLLPLGYVIWLMLKPLTGEDFTTDNEELDEPSSASVVPLTSLTPVGTVLTPAPTGTHDITGHFEDKWFIHSFIATYADTNSVGNVYFGMYAMWVGKTRELFFNRVMPKFNLKETPFYILTRSFEHKFVRETKEFEQVSVKIRVAGHNRKFVTLEHEIYDSMGNMLGKGSQSLLFVSSADYKMMDIPSEVMGAFLTYL
jgi:acyl-CoA thioesterase FadM